MTEMFNPLSLGLLVGVIYSICLHEAAHAYAADALGDPTARLLGRKTINPIPHIQATPFPTLILPLLTFFVSQGTMVFGGGACPVNVANLRNPRRDDILVSLAGPAANFLLSLIFAVLFLAFAGEEGTVLTALLFRIGLLNFILCAFNLLPFPPLDGSRVLSAWFPEVRRFYESIVTYGPFIPLLLAVLLFQALGPRIIGAYERIVVGLHSILG